MSPRAIVAPPTQRHGLSRRNAAPSSSAAASSPPSSSPDPGSLTRIIYRERQLSASDYLPFWEKTWFLIFSLLMALVFFGLSIYLVLNLDLNQSPSSRVSASSLGAEITYGSAIKLMHERTRFRLHSHDVPYGTGSGQQSVTAFPKVDDSNSYWIVRPLLGSSSKQGDRIKNGTSIRLQHMKTRKWLHSHLHASPISGNLEVSCYGGDDDSDAGDYWRLETEGGGEAWTQDQRIRLLHVHTGGYLHSHNKRYTGIAEGQHEVCGVREKRADNVWMAVEGVYLPVNEGK